MEANGLVYIAYKLMSQSSILWAQFSIRIYTNNNSFSRLQHVFFRFGGNMNI